MRESVLKLTVHLKRENVTCETRKTDTVTQCFT